MANFDYYEFYKELYFKENERRQEVESALTLPLAIVTALVAGMYVLLTTFSYDYSWLLTITFLCLVFPALIFLLYSVWWQSLAFVTRIGFLKFERQKGFFFKFKIKEVFQYKGIAFSEKLNEYHKELIEYYQKYYPDELNIDELIANQFKEYLINEFTKATDYNTATNDTKYTYVFNSKIFLVYSLWFSAFALAPYFVSYFHKNDDIYKVYIDNALKTEKFVLSKVDTVLKHEQHSPSLAPGAAAATDTTTGKNYSRRRDTTQAKRLSEESVKAKNIHNGRRK